MDKPGKKQQLARLLYFIFGATIVGETGVTSLIVSEVGVSVLSKLNFINGVLLFLLPTFFFSQIDSSHRGNLLQKTLRAAIGIVSILFILYTLSAAADLTFYTAFLLILYPLSYLLKTILFLTFWTVAVDVNDTMEAKLSFPEITAWGFIGGLSGAIASRLLLIPFSPEFILLFWVFLYILAYLYTAKFNSIYGQHLVPIEAISGRSKNTRSLIGDIKEILTMPLVKNIGYLYFFTYIAIFMLDYFFGLLPVLSIKTLLILRGFNSHFILLIVLSP
ncbi:hypothetical protein [Chitinivibrio alkaliphilus]|uniref:MFS transporter n=1 Tax=Chitinivibrio alkaliphilus ACht1 TaxID=1313304 RepID=U7DB04_9BACT|nr:hypothetical protein [Chitinivibrio alkaliphilus]ERP31585.1 hypothetical protein CALK_1448 [Chitinivibrio alkaliphilus ACht1]